MGGQLPLNTNLQSVAWGEGSLSQGPLLEGRNDMDIQGSWPATAPGREEDISRPGERVGDQAGHLFGGSQGGRLGSAEDDVPDGVVAGYPIPVASTADLVVTKRVSCVVAFRAGVGGAVKGHSQPVA